MNIRRRTFLITGSLVAFGGCLDQADGDGASTPTPTPTPQETPTPTPTPQETPPEDVPAPELVDISLPDQATVGEQFRVTVIAQNGGARAGHWSTVTTSFPAFDDPDDAQHLSIVQEDFGAWSGTIAAGSEIVDRQGNRIPAEYAVAEAGSNADTYWDAGAEHRLGLAVTPEQSGPFTIYVRTTLTKEDNISQQFTAPPREQADAVDQQGFPVRQIQVDVDE